MTVLTFGPLDMFIVRITKNLISNPDNKWANSYEFVANNDGTNSDLIALGGILVSFEAAIHTEAVRFDRILISTWEPDSVPYDPAAFISVSVTQDGLRSDVPNEIEPLGMALRVTRQATSGRFGNLFYRGSLFENEVSSPSGKSILTNRGDVQDFIDAGITSSGLDDYIGASPVAILGLSLISADGTQRRAVTGLRAQGVSLVKEDHTWFNRTTTP